MKCDLVAPRRHFRATFDFREPPPKCARAKNHDGDHLAQLQAGHFLGWCAVRKGQDWQWCEVKPAMAVKLLYRSEPIGVIRKIVRAWRDVVRWHRDQVGDDRCWLDDWKIYEVVLKGKSVLPAKRECALLCAQYHECRSVSAKLHKRLGMVRQPQSNGHDVNSDLLILDRRQLEAEWVKLFVAVLRHERIGDGERCAADDRELYRVLPEKKLANQTLPRAEDFLPSCRRFINSRKQSCKLHEW